MKSEERLPPPPQVELEPEEIVVSDEGIFENEENEQGDSKTRKSLYDFTKPPEEIERIIQEAYVSDRPGDNAYRYAESVARHFYRKYSEKSSDFTLDDFIQIARIGLMIAADKFDPNRGGSFKTVAFSWMRQAIQREISRSGTVQIPEYVQRLSKKFSLEKRKLMKENSDEEPEEKDVQLAAGLEDWEMESIRIARPWATSNRRDTLRGRDHEEDRPLLDTVASDASASFDHFVGEHSRSPEEKVVQTQTLLSLIAEAGLSSREREVLKYRYGLEGEREYLYEEIGKILGLNRETIRKEELKALAKLKSAQKRLGHV